VAHLAIWLVLTLVAVLAVFLAAAGVVAVAVRFLGSGLAVFDSKLFGKEASDEHLEFRFIRIGNVLFTLSLPNEMLIIAA
jgi:ABC-type uncharacterized transport system permease subunit